MNDPVIVAARIFLAALFLIFGWRKVQDCPGTVSQMVRDDLPMPVLATAIAIVMELGVSSAIALGLFARVAAVLMAFYTLATSLVEHRYWQTHNAERVEKMEAFYKNLAIIGGFLLLAVTGPGRISLDAVLGIAAL